MHSNISAQFEVWNLAIKRFKIELQWSKELEGEEGEGEEGEGEDAHTLMEPIIGRSWSP